ncbi:hypothetical protein V6N11_029807 [Hibiscus sabdariffa]|uniref:Uncharacterized protein n=2 Tax=Hibiscus sabdariffa TaxID=183260 RepID=A0ABR2AEZ1_9ROSI
MMNCGYDHSFFNLSRLLHFVGFVAEYISVLFTVSRFCRMARELKYMMKPWIEAAPPSLIDFPSRASNIPKLETIKEERAEEEYEDDDDYEDNHESKNFINCG